MTLFQRWKQTALHNKALVLTGVIVAFGTLVSTAAVVVQVCIMRVNDRSTSQQVDKLIVAANIQVNAAARVAEASGRSARAAEDFAGSADKINQQAELSVREMRGMVTQIHAVNTQASKALTAQLRPWIEVGENLKGVPVAYSGANQIFDAASLTLLLRNFGQSPAIITDVHFVFADLTYAQIKYWKYNLNDPDLCATQHREAFLETLKSPVFPGIAPTDKTTEAFVGKSKVAHTGSPPWHLSGCIVYYDTMGNGPYFTRVVYWVTYSPDFKNITNIDRQDIDVQ